MTVIQELETIAKRNGGAISPEKVVKFARNKKTALHGRFTWDDTEAAEAYRLWQARTIIRVHVTVINGDKKPVRAFVSLRQDRGTVGYRRIVDVLATPDLRAIMLEEAKAEMQVFAAKYRTLSELSPVIRAIDKVVNAKPSRNRPENKQGRRSSSKKDMATAGT